MASNNLNSKIRNVNLVLLLVIIINVVILINQLGVMAAPQGASIIYNYTENASVRQADSHTAAGGSFTTMVLNISSQTSKWKAYVGNVTGKISLDNSNNFTIYDWALTNVQGEVYVSRNNSVNFTSLACANSGNITSEDSFLSINSSTSDSINKTFNQTKHKSFVIGGTGTIQNSTCFALATYVNDTAQPVDENATFQEVLLSDKTNLVFVAIINDNKQGFDLGTYDFQLIVPDNPTEISTAYYFYAELG
jgi:hypothetical protein